MGPRRLFADTQIYHLIRLSILCPYYLLLQYSLICDQVYNLSYILSNFYLFLFKLQKKKKKILFPRSPQHERSSRAPHSRTEARMADLALLLDAIPRSYQSVREAMVIKGVLGGILMKISELSRMTVRKGGFYFILFLCRIFLIFLWCGIFIFFSNAFGERFVYVYSSLLKNKWALDISEDETNRFVHKNEQKKKRKKSINIIINITPPPPGRPLLPRVAHQASGHAGCPAPLRQGAEEHAHGRAEPRGGGREAGHEQKYGVSYVRGHKKISGILGIIFFFSINNLFFLHFLGVCPSAIQMQNKGANQIMNF